MPSVIKSIEKDSPAGRTKLCPGERLLSVNGKEIKDVLDYKFYTYDRKLVLEIEDRAGRRRHIKIIKQEGEPLGIEFETYLMDSARACSNRCIFCFVDQMPRGMRKTLYFKDDDMRLSFLMGNYITLTNLSEREVQRIIDLRISPINVSVHSTNPELRSELLGNPRGGEGIELMRRFAENGITMNCQIVCCPEYNDGAELQRSMEDLAEMYPGVNSVSIVPVGLTKFREKLTPIRPFDRELAAGTIRQVENFSEICLEKFGTRIFFCADEMYLKAGIAIPEDEFYEEYAQLENGVGMLRLLETEFDAELEVSAECRPEPFSVATGVSAAPFIERLLQKAKEKLPQLDGRVFPIVNEFFGTTIDVAGLVTGGDMIRRLKSENLGKYLLIPDTMLRHGEGVFLDDITLEDVSRELSVKVVPVRQDGGFLLRAMLSPDCNE